MKTKSASRLLSVSSDAKTVKGEILGYLTGILYLAANIIPGLSLCPNASAGCSAACLLTAGRAGVFPAIIRSRINKTLRFFENRAAFITQLIREIGNLVENARRKGLTAVIRLNGTSDIAWERIAPEIFSTYSSTQFYDYTKSIRRMLEFLSGQFPANYHLTFSWSGTNRAECETVLANGGNVAIPFAGAVPVGSSFLGSIIVDGDSSDARFLDARHGERGVVIGLKAKGKARKDLTGFTVRYTLPLPKDPGR